MKLIKPEPYVGLTKADVEEAIRRYVADFGKPTYVRMYLVPISPMMKEDDLAATVYFSNDEAS
jgi:hypothetical protein